jgi:cell division protein FtsB
VTLRRWLIAALVVAALVFALQGGEYSTPQWLGLRSRLAAESVKVAALAAEVDSLRRVLDQAEHDPATQERIAREKYGMLRPGEKEITLVYPDAKPPAR